MRLVQPDRRSCGAACLVVAARASSPEVAARIPDQEAFAREVLRTHRRITSLVDRAGSLQVPWLRAIGTAPWAAARELRLITGVDYSTHATPIRHDAWEHVRTATQRRPVAVYIGDRLCPRHVVLVLEATDDGAWTYEPATGNVRMVARERWATGPLELAGWDRPWITLAPS